MKHRIYAVLFCIAIFAIVGCDNDNSPDFRESRWGDSKEQVKSSEFDLQRQSGFSDDLGFPRGETSTAVFYTSRVKLEDYLPYVLRSGFSTRLYGSKGFTMNPYLFIRYGFDGYGLCSGAYRIDSLSRTQVDSILKSALRVYGKPTDTLLTRSLKSMVWITESTGVSLTARLRAGRWDVEWLQLSMLPMNPFDDILFAPGPIIDRRWKWEQPQRSPLLEGVGDGSERNIFDEVLEDLEDADVPKQPQPPPQRSPFLEGVGDLEDADVPKQPPNDATSSSTKKTPKMTEDLLPDKAKVRSMVRRSQWKTKPFSAKNPERIRMTGRLTWGWGDCFKLEVGDKEVFCNNSDIYLQFILDANDVIDIRDTKEVIAKGARALGMSQFQMNLGIDDKVFYPNGNVTLTITGVIDTDFRNGIIWMKDVVLISHNTGSEHPAKANR